MRRKVLVLGIESTAHTLGVGIAEKRGKKTRALSNAIAKYPSSTKGYLPRKLADHHAQKFKKTLNLALREANCKLSEIDAIAFARGPGIGHCLQTGFTAARSLSIFASKPLVPVNHAIAHAMAVKIVSGAKDPLAVYVSGGNTQIFFKEHGKLHVIGETLDIGIGNFLDQLGRTLKLSPPDAVGVLMEAKKSKNLLELPYVVKGMSTSYSGMLTFIQRKMQTEPKTSKADACFSAQETAFAALCEAAERALLHSQKKALLLCGGNARNKRLQEMMKLVAKAHKAKFCIAEDALLGDNGAMIALCGIAMLEAQSVPHEIMPSQDLRVDAEKIPYW